MISPSIDTVASVNTKELEEDWITKFNSWAWSSNAIRLFSMLSEVLWVERVRLWSLDLENITAPRNQALAFDFADREYLNDLLDKNELPVSQRDKKYFCDLLERGDKFVVATMEGKLVFYGFVALGRKRMFSKYFTLEDREFFIMRFWTNPEYRGRGIYPQAIAYVCKSLVAQGYERGYLDVSTHNNASIRGVIKAGCKRLDTYYDRLRLLGFDKVIPRGALKSRFVN
jgi:ribosomal protein S18 acetylase RimI-like enzyme